MNESSVNTEANVSDYLNPSIDALEPEPVLNQVPVDPDAPTAEDLQRSLEAKQKFYADQKAEKEGVTRSALDHGQESIHSPEAQAQLAQSHADAKKADEKRSLADKVLHPGKK